MGGYRNPAHLEELASNSATPVEAILDEELFVTELKYGNSKLIG
jgi:hypothetical protein